MDWNRYYKVSFDYKGVEYSFLQDLLGDDNIFDLVRNALAEKGVEYDGSMIVPRAETA
jgi:hypothetical protein